MIKYISSFKNENIKNIIKLSNNTKNRIKNNLFIVEGNKENYIAIKNGFIPVKYYICPEIIKKSVNNIYNKIKNKSNITYISKKIFEKISYRKNTEGIICIYKYPNDNKNISINKNKSLNIIIDNIEKPGNIGAILRSADAFKIDNVIICNKDKNIFSPNIIRSSLGTVFCKNIFFYDNQEILDILKKNKVKIYSTTLSNEHISLLQTKFEYKTAIILGNESKGISKFWQKNCDIRIKIPMKGVIDSLNVSCTASICMYEYFKQNLHD